MLVTWTGDFVTSRLDLAVWLLRCSQLLSLMQPVTENFFMVLGSPTDIVPANIESGSCKREIDQTTSQL